MLAFTAMLVIIRTLRYAAQLPRSGPVAMSVVSTITHLSTLVSLFVMGVCTYHIPAIVVLSGKQYRTGGGAGSSQKSPGFGAEPTPSGYVSYWDWGWDFVLDGMTSLLGTAALGKVKRAAGANPAQECP